MPKAIKRREYAPQESKGELARGTPQQTQTEPTTPNALAHNALGPQSKSAPGLLPTLENRYMGSPFIYIGPVFVA